MMLQWVVGRLKIILMSSLCPTFCWIHLSTSLHNRCWLMWVVIRTSWNVMLLTSQGFIIFSQLSLESKGNVIPLIRRTLVKPGTMWFGFFFPPNFLTFPLACSNFLCSKGMEIPMRLMRTKHSNQTKLRENFIKAEWQLVLIILTTV